MSGGYGLRAFRALSLAGILGASGAVAQPADVTLNDLGYTAGPLTYRIPTLVVRGTHASREELIRLADPATAGILQAEHLDERLRAFEAEEIAVPELTVETGPADARVTVTARDIRASGIKGGRVASVTVGGSEIAAKVPGGAKAPDKVLRGSIGRITIQDLDLALAASLAEPGTGEPLQALYGSVSLEALRLTEPGGVTLRLDRLTSRDVRARRTEAGWGSAVAALSSATAPVPRERLLAILAEWSASMKLGSFEAGGLGFELAGPDRQSARIGQIGFAEGTPALNMEDVEIGGAEGRLTIGRATLGGVPADIAAAQSGGDALHGILPGSGSIRLESVALAGPELNAVTIGTAEFGVTRSAAAATPTAFSFAARDIAVPSRPQDAALKPLVDLGYAGLAGSIEGAATYDEPREELSIERVRLRADGMGEVGLGARLVHVSPDLFQRDTTRAALALLGMQVRSIDLAIEDNGLAERLVERQARLTGAKPDDIRRQYAGAAGFGVMMTLGSNSGAQTLGTALSGFVTKPGRLKVALTAKDAVGLGISDLVTGPDPRAILDRIEVTASAE